MRRTIGPHACRKLSIYALPTDFVLSVIVPVYNERKTIAEVVKRLRDTGLPMQIILVDDGSNDGTAAAIDQFDRAQDVVRSCITKSTRAKAPRSDPAFGLPPVTSSSSKTPIKNTIPKTFGHAATDHPRRIRYRLRDAIRALRSILLALVAPIGQQSFDVARKSCGWHPT